MDFSTFKQKIFAEAKRFGFSDWEIYYSESTGFSAKIFGGEISEYKNTDSVGLSFRGTFGGRVGYSFTERLDESLIAKLVQNAADNAAVIEEKEIEKLYPGDSEYPQVVSFNPALEGVSAADKLAAAFALEKHAYAADSRVKSVDYCVLGTGKNRVNIANSYGQDLSHDSNMAYAYVSVRVEENGVVKTAGELWFDNDFGKFSHEKIADTAVQKALSYLGAKSVDSKNYPVIFDNETACDFFGAFAGVFFAENAQKGFSLLDGKEGEKIAADCVTLRDDGVCEHYPLGNVPFDSEGVATQQKAIIENGVLRTLLYNTKTAEKAGKKSTGNGFKPGFAASVGTSTTNFYIAPSQTTPEQLRADIKQGLLITQMAGLHAGLNAISGEFSISSDGFLIEDGKITRPVEQITVAGNFYELLKNIQAVGSDLRFDMPNAGACGMPSLYVGDLAVSGL